MMMEKVKNTTDNDRAVRPKPDLPDMVPNACNKTSSLDKHNRVISISQLSAGSLGSNDMVES